jgi:hypothetical protein
MNRLSLLKALVNVIFVLCVVALVFIPPTLIVIYTFPETIPFSINGTPAKEIGTEELILMSVLILGAAFEIYALYVFRKTLALFEKRQIFTTDVIKLLDQTGKAIIIGYMISAGASLLYKAVVAGTIEIGLNVSFGSAIFILGLGLFFIVLSDVFSMAKQMKDENDLTV